MKAPELRTELEKRKLSTKGKKGELMERLAEDVEKKKAKFAKKHLEKALAEFADMKDKDLRKQLDKRDLSTKGKTEELQKRLKEAFESFINTDSRCANYLAHYIDEMLRSGLRGRPENEVEQMLDKMIRRSSRRVTTRNEKQPQAPRKS